MTRVLSALLLLPIVVGVVWLLPPAATLALAAAVALLAVLEYVRLAEALGAPVPRALTAAATVLACVGTGGGLVPVDVVLLAALLSIGVVVVATRAPGPSALPAAAAAVFAVAYIGLALGAVAAIHRLAGREAVLLLMATIVISDSAQYYAGRAFGTRPLAPSISPKKTREGALGGVVFGAGAMVLGGRLLFPGVALPWLLTAAVAVVAMGMAGDLFESLLKRSAGVKDSSHLIPGHGGVLDRIDSWLFAGPVYYVFVRLQA